MKTSIVPLPLAALLLASCAAPAASTQSATGATAATQASTATASTAAATPTPSGSVQGLKTALDGMTPQQSDDIFLSAARKSIPTGTDADLKAAGHKVCEYMADGVTGEALTAKVEALGYTPAQTMTLVITAGLTYCKSK
ncbi:DUF732 domain-containing protein [bacterium RCC_150]